MRLIFALALAVGGLTAAAATAQAPAKTPWGTPTLTDWNGIWSAYRGPSVKTVPQPVPVPTPKYAPYLEAAKEASAKNMEINHQARCLPPGTPTQSGLTYPGEMFISPRKVTMVFEDIGFRTIWTDGRNHSDYVEPSYRGESIGRWEGDTFVIDTIGISTKTILAGGARHSSKLRVVERLREVQPGIIEIRIRLEDPLAFQAPIEYVVAWHKTPGEEVKEYVCENNVEEDVIKNTFDAFVTLGEPIE